MENDKNKTIRLAALIAVFGNAGLAVLKIVAGIISRSGALLSDGIDSASDVLISAITLVVVRIISKPADIKHPWGHGRAETIATVFLSFMLFFMGAQLAVNCVTKLFSGEMAAIPSSIAIVVSVISIIGKSLLAFSQYALGRRANSAMIKANGKNMLSDVLISVGVIVGLIISNITGAAYADTIISGLIGLMIIKTAIEIFAEANLELMDGNDSTESYQVIADAVKNVEGASHPHRARMRKIAGFWDIDLDIDVDPDCTVLEAHGIASRVEMEIKRNLENVYDIMIHVEPMGDEDDEETFGLDEKMMRSAE